MPQATACSATKGPFSLLPTGPAHRLGKLAQSSSGRTAIIRNRKVMRHGDCDSGPRHDGGLTASRLALRR